MGNLKISFGICISPSYETPYLSSLVESIEKQMHRHNIDYEILIIGQYNNDVKGKITHIEFDESQKSGWITKKKNVLVKEAAYDIVCLLHDYYVLADDWAEGLIRFIKENPNWKVLSNRILRKEGDRHSDWLVNQKYMDQVIARYPDLGSELMNVAPTENNGPRWVCGLPYDEMDLKQLQYISGGYILAKKDIFSESPFDERYGWGEAAEDIIWSEDVISKGHRFDFNPYSTVTLQKYGKWRVYQMTDNCVNCLKEMFSDNNKA